MQLWFCCGGRRWGILRCRHTWKAPCCWPVLAYALPLPEAPSVFRRDEGSKGNSGQCQGVGPGQAALARRGGACCHYAGRVEHANEGGSEHPFDGPQLRLGTCLLVGNSLLRRFRGRSLLRCFHSSRSWRLLGGLLSIRLWQRRLTLLVRLLVWHFP